MNWYKKRTKTQKQVMTALSGLLVFVGLCFSGNYLLQLSQNNLNWQLVNQFIFAWHTEKFMLGCVVLACLLAFCQSLLGSFAIGGLVFTIVISMVSVANYLKNFYRSEPLYPEDFKMITEISLFKEMVGLPLIISTGLIVIGVLVLVSWQLKRSIQLTKRQQRWRSIGLLISCLGLVYVSQFNKDTNLLRQAYNKTALWIPYSQPMNYYNTGFIGGFLYNLSIEPMVEPRDYSEEAIKKIVASYPSTPGDSSEKPNIIFVMSESFSDPSRLNGITIPNNPLGPYKQLAEETYSGQMLSQNYGGGTANIEFEALTGLSMEPLNSQLTTPYTMLVNKLSVAPSLVSFLKGQGYYATAIHPYNTTMYKRKSVYDTFGFDQFLSEDTMGHREKIQHNKYISDKSAFSEVLDQLDRGQDQQFVHLVTMQTHMPYGEKYEVETPLVKDVTNPNAISNYLIDVGYTSQALESFLEDLKKLPRRTVVVFWGDHLPSIYGDDIKESNSPEALHLTEFAFFDSQGKMTGKDDGPILSPIYFGPKLMEMVAMPQSGFYHLLNKMRPALPAFEKNQYYQNQQWSKNMRVSPELEQLYHDYLLVQYDLVAGKQYSVHEGFYESDGTPR